MQWIWTWFGSKPNLQPWTQRPFSPTVELGQRPNDNRDNHEREVGVEAPGEPDANGLHRRAAAAIMSFHVFPPRLATPVLLREPVAVGDAVGLRYPFVPGLDLLFASRVIDVFDGRVGHLWRTGFTYRTLQGHPELGEEVFCVEKDLATGRVVVALRSWSRAGSLLAWVFAPIVRRLQLHAGRRALDQLTAVAAGHWPRDEVPRRDDAIGTPSGSGLPATTTSRSAR
jgi:uncharacterized protein (UPF0548 family)